jgi:hypothetical protein
MFLEILFWMLVLLAVIGYFMRDRFGAYNDVVLLILIILLGIRDFGAPH